MARETDRMHVTAPTDVMLKEAERWHFRMTSDKGKNQYQEAFKTWYDESPLHQQAYAQVFMCKDAGVSFRQSEAQEAVPPISANDNTRFITVFGAVAACLLILALGVTFFFQAPSFTEYETQMAEVRSIQLEDGSVVILGAASRVLVAEFSGDTRRVILEQGEALFDVAHNKEKPFWVTSGDTTVKVLGTKFTVNSTVDYVSVALLDGKVTVRQITEASLIPFLEEEAVVTLLPAQSVTVTDGFLNKPKTQNIDQMATWVDGKRSYFDAPLSLVVADINRYLREPVHLDSTEIGNLPVTLVFGFNQIDSVLQSLPQILPVTVSTGPYGTVIKAVN